MGLNEARQKGKAAMIATMNLGLMTVALATIALAKRMAMWAGTMADRLETIADELE